MRYSRVYIDSLGFELAPEVVTTQWLEDRLAPLYHQLNIPTGQLEVLTGVTERRFWPPGSALAPAAARAGSRALQGAGVDPQALGAVLYASVCRDHLEPATACAVAAALGVPPQAAIHDVANACLGVLSGIVDLANRVELGQIRAGLVVACESAREINEHTLTELLTRGDRTRFGESLATFTGGSGAAAVLLTDGSFPGGARHRLLGGACRGAPEHHSLCQWGYRLVEPGRLEPYARTDAPAVLRHGVALATATWTDFLKEMEWTPATVDRCISHQIGRSHRQQMLEVLGLDDAKDFPTYAYLGNMGTVSLPLTAALAEERGHLRAGDRVALLGIGSGLNCMMLGVEW
jgi:3-oxoacyl-[acyl-carrier-protein] synthase-3